MGKSLVEFLHSESVPDLAVCDQQHERGPCESLAMMRVRVKGREHLFCYEHLSLLYDRVTRPRDPHPKMV